MKKRVKLKRMMGLGLVFKIVMMKILTLLPMFRGCLSKDLKSLRFNLGVEHLFLFFYLAFVPRNTHRPWF